MERNDKNRIDRYEKIPCLRCRKPISKVNKAIHEKLCKKVDATLDCQLCPFSTTMKRQFKQHNKEAHNLSVQFANLYCVACDTIVPRKPLHMRQKTHQKKTENWEGESIVKEFSYRVIPFKKRTKRRKSQQGVGEKDACGTIVHEKMVEETAGSSDDSTEEDFRLMEDQSIAKVEKVEVEATVVFTQEKNFEKMEGKLENEVEMSDKNGCMDDEFWKRLYVADIFPKLLHF